MVLNDNKLMGPLKGHSTLEYGKGIEVINDERLHHKKAAADASTAAIETTKKKMEVFVEEELEPAATTCEKVAEDEEMVKEVKRKLEKKNDEEKHNLIRSFEEHRAKGMVQVNRRYEEVKRANDEASAQLSEKADEAKFFL